MPKSKSFVFDGGAANYFGTCILAALIIIFTLGIGYPWGLCLIQRWKAKHTYIQGRRLKFTGTGLSLIGLWLKWFVFLIITLGIYSFWLIPSLQRWITEHTDFVEEVNVVVLKSQSRQTVQNIHTGKEEAKIAEEAKKDTVIEPKKVS